MAKHSSVIYSNLTKPIIRLIEKAAYRHTTWQVFQDFLLMAATSISNSIDALHRDDREKGYLEVVKKYTHDELELFPQMFAELVNVLEQCAKDEDITDVLGRVFHELELHNTWHGQFFTPQSVADFMGEISIDGVDSTIARRGYVTVCEPCCGSGVMVISFAKAMQKSKLNYCSQMVVDATDIDIKCVHMAYIQLSLYGIPAIIRHGNSLTMEEWSQWYTPVYRLGGWAWRNYLGDDSTKNVDDSTVIVDEPAESVGEQQNMENDSDTQVVVSGGDIAEAVPITTLVHFDITLQENKNGQMSLF